MFFPQPYDFAFVLASILWLSTGMGLGLWYFYRKHFYLLWQAVSCGLGGVVMLGMTRWMQLDSLAFILGMSALYLLAMVCTAQSVVLRMGRRLRLEVVLGVALLLLGGMLYLWQVQARWSSYIQWQSIGLGLVLCHVLPTLWRAPRRNNAEFWMLLAYTCVALVMLLRPLAVDMTLIGLGQWVSLPSIWGSSTWVMVVVNVVFSISILACTLNDSVYLPSSLAKDPQTGLLNARGLEATYGAQPYDSGIRFVVLCELDQGADIALHDTVTLRQIAQLLQACVREGDVVAHLGQAEFALVLRNQQPADVQRLLQRLQTSLQHMQQTIHFGVAHVQPQDTLVHAMHHADVMLYQAKESMPAHAAPVRPSAVR